MAAELQAVKTTGVNSNASAKEKKEGEVIIGQLKFHLQPYKPRAGLKVLV